MHGLYNLKEMLCKELEEYGERGELNSSSLDVIDKLAHAAKNIDKIIMCKEDETMGGSFDGGSYDMGSYDGGASNGGSYRSMSQGNMYRSSYNDYSSRRGRDSMGRYASRRGYSRADDMAQQLRTLAGQATDDRTRQELQRLADQMGQG